VALRHVRTKERDLVDLTDVESWSNQIDGWSGSR
jgi:hypothetical protein